MQDERRKIKYILYNRSREKFVSIKIDWKWKNKRPIFNWKNISEDKEEKCESALFMRLFQKVTFLFWESYGTFRKKSLILMVDFLKFDTQTWNLSYVFSLFLNKKRGLTLSLSSYVPCLSTHQLTLLHWGGEEESTW